MKTQKNNNDGFGLIELLVIIGVLAVLSAGISRMISAYYAVSTQTNVSQSMEALRAQINGALLDEVGWRLTLAEAKNAADTILGCLNGTVVCQNGMTYGPISIRDQNNNLLFDGTTGTSGFTLDGRPCATFSAVAGAGDDACPISFARGTAGAKDFPRWTASCPMGRATCTNPTIAIDVQWTYNASSSASRVALNSDRYNLTITKSLLTTNRTFVLAEAISNRVSTGPCVAGGSVNRNINKEIDDSSNLVTLAGGGLFQLRAGSYRCRVTVPGYKVGLFSADLMMGPVGGPYNSIAIGSALATADPNNGEWGGQTNAVIDTAFTINQTREFRVRQNCSQAGVAEAWDPTGCGNGQNYALGIPVPTGTAVGGCGPRKLIYSVDGTNLTIVSCERVN